MVRGRAIILIVLMSIELALMLFFASRPGYPLAGRSVFGRLLEVFIYIVPLAIGMVAPTWRAAVVCGATPFWLYVLIYWVVTRQSDTPASSTTAEAYAALVFGLTLFIGLSWLSFIAREMLRRGAVGDTAR